MGLNFAEVTEKSVVYIVLIIFASWLDVCVTAFQSFKEIGCPQFQRGLSGPKPNNHLSFVSFHNP